MHPGRFALVVDSWFDGERLHRQRHTLRVIEGRLATAVEGDHEQALRQQGWPVERAAFLMPGLVDVHVHLFLDGIATDGRVRSEHLKRPVAQLTEAAREHAREALSWGVTLVRDAGDRHGINHQVREEAAAPGSGMARVRSAGRGLKRAKRYGAFMGTDAGEIGSLACLVEELAGSSDEIKLILSGIIDFDAGAVTDEPQFDLAETTRVVQTAHRCGRKVMAHCSGARALSIAVAARVDSIEHGFFMDCMMLARMRDEDLAWTPTFSPVHFQWAHPEAAGWPPATVDTMRRILDDHIEHLRVAHQMGVRLLVGTDAGSMGVQHGRAVFEEIGHFVAAGLPLEAALRAATGTARRHLGDPHPRLVPGAPFEALLFDALPFGEGATLARPRRVWRGVPAAAALPH